MVKIPKAALPPIISHSFVQKLGGKLYFGGQENILRGACLMLRCISVVTGMYLLAASMCRNSGQKVLHRARQLISFASQSTAPPLVEHAVVIVRQEPTPETQTPGQPPLQDLFRTHSVGRKPFFPPFKGSATCAAAALL